MLDFLIDKNLGDITQILPSKQELMEAFITLNQREQAILLQIFMWFYLVYLPLTKVDRRDNLTGLTYVCAASLFGLILFIPPPFIDVPPLSMETYFVLLFVFISIATLRWFSQYLGINRRPKGNENG